MCCGEPGCPAPETEASSSGSGGVTNVNTLIGYGGGTCPHCGRCPHCGQPYPNLNPYPYAPWVVPTVPWYPGYPYTWITYSSGASYQQSGGGGSGYNGGAQVTWSNGPVQA